MNSYSIATVCSHHPGQLRLLSLSHTGSLSSERRLYKEGSIQTCLPKKGSSPVKIGAQAP